jgi:penicillin-binding protein 1A
MDTPHAPDRRPRERLVPRAAIVLAAVLALLPVARVAEPAAADLLRTPLKGMTVEFVIPDGPELAPLEERSLIRASDGRPLANVHGAYNRRVIPLEILPDHVWQTVLVAEDRRFFEHDGYDLRAIARATRANIDARGIVEGGSTITQQIAKNIVGDDVTLERKVRELRYAIALEERYSKEQLLERYLNEIYFGGGAYGIAAAAEGFFNLQPHELDPGQSALLAGMIRSPSLLDPRRNPEAATARRDAILLGMVAEGYLPARQAAALIRRPIDVWPARDGKHRDPEIVAAVQQAFLDNPAFGETREERARLLLTGGLEITTTIDIDLQRATTALLQERFPDPDGTSAAIAAVEPVTGAIRVAAYGRQFHRDEFNVALQGRRQPGSAFKPFVLAAALEAGYPLSTSLEGTSGARFGTERATGPWATRGVRNFGGRSHGRIDARTALVRSINTAFADLVMRIGAHRVLEVTDDLGISREAFGGLENAGIALGGLRRGVTPLEMASAYGAFANRGIHTTPYLIHRVVDRHGRVIYQAEPRGRRALTPEVNVTMVEVLGDVVRHGTGTRANLPGWDVAGKTGTTQQNWDVWFVGATPALSAAASPAAPRNAECCFPRNGLPAPSTIRRGPSAVGTDPARPYMHEPCFLVIMGNYVLFRNPSEEALQRGGCYLKCLPSVDASLTAEHFRPAKAAGILPQV